MRVAYGLLAVGSGCAQLFGIDDTTGGQAAALELRRVSVGATVTTSPQDLAAVPTFYAGTDAMPGMLATAGRWTTTLAADSVGYKAPDLPAPYLHVFAVSAPTLKASFTAFEHPSPQAAQPASLMVDVTLPTPYAGETLELAAIGAWTHHVLVGAEVPLVNAASISTTIPYAMFMPMTASPAAQITMADVVVVLRRLNGELTGVFVVPPFDLATTPAISGAMTAVTAATAFDAAIDPPTVASRFGALVPAVTGVALGWRVDAAPGHDVGATTGIQLQAGALTMASTSIAASYTNPFDAQQWKPVLTYTASAGRSFMLGGATTTLSASLATYADPATGLTLDLPAGLPRKISLDQTDLVTDGAVMAVDPTLPHDIDLSPDRPGNTYYIATVEDIAVVGTSVTRTIVVSVGGPDPKLTLPANVLQHGHTYAIDAQCIAGGYSQAATGDLQTFTLPASVGAATSAVFTIAP